MSQGQRTSAETEQIINDLNAAMRTAANVVTASHRLDGTAVHTTAVVANPNDMLSVEELGAVWSALMQAAINLASVGDVMRAAGYLNLATKVNAIRNNDTPMIAIPF